MKNSERLAKFQRPFSAGQFARLSLRAADAIEQGLRPGQILTKAKGYLVKWHRFGKCFRVTVSNRHNKFAFYTYGDEDLSREELPKHLRSAFGEQAKHQ